MCVISHRNILNQVKECKYKNQTNRQSANKVQLSQPFYSDLFSYVPIKTLKKIIMLITTPEKHMESMESCNKKEKISE